jgi:hypothetical protein
MTIPDAGLIVTGRYNSMLGYPHLCARLRYRVQPEAVEIALDAIVRRDSLDPAARLAVFDALAAHFRGIIEFPDEATLQLTSEQYVRNCIEIILKPAVRSVAVRPQEVAS